MTFQSKKKRNIPQKRPKRANIYKIRATNLYFATRSVRDRQKESMDRVSELIPHILIHASFPNYYGKIIKNE